MVCPNCKTKYTQGHLCPNCKMDSVLYAGTLRISDALYNKGLIKAKAADLSGALECLAKSIEFNKNNIQARNLLGLVQHEVGHVGDALKHWVISCSLQRDNNPAKYYIDEAQKSGRSLERLNDAVQMYNQALDDLKQNSDDMAIIKLRKSVEINPKFIDAHNLLCYCYLVQRESDHDLMSKIGWKISDIVEFESAEKLKDWYGNINCNLKFINTCDLKDCVIGQFSNDWNDNLLEKNCNKA